MCRDCRLCHGFDDIHCMDRTNSLRYRLANACKTSFPILDENVEKITLRRRVEKLELALPKKSEKLAVLEMEQELRRALATKAEQEVIILLLLLFGYVITLGVTVVTMNSLNYFCVDRI